MASADALDAEISHIHTRIAQLQAHRASLTSILLSQPHLPARLQQRPVANEGRRRNAAKVVKRQANRNLENIYRACAGVTAYKVKDPDPHAVDNGNVLGVRVEVSVGSRFIETYHVLFNRPSDQHRSMLKIHKHTVPPCIPLQLLASKWLPTARKGATEQNLVKFGRALRKELVSWHLREETVEKLRIEAGLGDRDARQKKQEVEPAIGKVLNAFVSDDEGESDDDHEPVRNGHEATKIMDIESDTAVREISITWSDGRVGVMKLTKDGQIDRAVVRDHNGNRDLSLGRKAVGRVEGLIERLRG